MDRTTFRSLARDAWIPSWAGCLVILLFLVSPSVRPDHIDDGAALRFAAEMARGGSWREARFRWERLLRERPDDVRVLNNLGVACEVLGEPETALQFYRKARTTPNAPDPVQTNARRFERFWRQAAPELDWAQAAAETDPAAEPTGSGKKPRKKNKTWEVTVSLPVPPRVELRGDERVLVASFLHRESDLFDVNRETVRFTRRELSKGTDLEILDVNPPPAVPEQTLEDLIANDEFWRYLGRDFDADVIVSGILRYESGDASTFRDVDVISPVTGQKVRSAQFVEQEEFLLIIDLLFMDGRTGDLLHRDRLQRAAVFPGLANDPFTAFYSLGDSIVGDVLSVVTIRRRSEIRWIYR